MLTDEEELKIRKMGFLCLLFLDRLKETMVMSIQKEGRKRAGIFIPFDVNGVEVTRHGIRLRTELIPYGKFGHDCSHIIVPQLQLKRIKDLVKQGLFDPNSFFEAERMGAAYPGLLRVNKPYDERNHTE
ncbi:hypothetical protein [Paraprevotella xylaniphila]|uniref:hypothetical protein n=1 Tax=Paraprevotella xylaniphila TaxID=454155 RepID=UPI003AB40E7D